MWYTHHTVSLQLRNNTSDSTPPSSNPTPKIAARRTLSYTLVLNFEIAVRLRAEVALVEVMYAHETVLSARCIAVALRRNRDSGVMDLVSLGRMEDRIVTYVLTGPKWPLTRPTSSSNTLCQNRVSNLPCRSEVVVTLMASWPPPRRT